MISSVASYALEPIISAMPRCTEGEVGNMSEKMEHLKFCKALVSEGVNIVDAPPKVYSQLLELESGIMRFSINEIRYPNNVLLGRWDNYLRIRFSLIRQFKFYRLISRRYNSGLNLCDSIVSRGLATIVQCAVDGPWLFRVGLRVGELNDLWKNVSPEFSLIRLFGQPQRVISDLGRSFGGISSLFGVGE